VVTDNLAKGSTVRHLDFTDRQVFDLEVDPEELNDLGINPDYRAIVAEYGAILRNICDSESEDRLAKEK
jgi:hypothetical protein